jgi:hypothetical protein
MKPNPDLNYRLVVPSRGRPDNMYRLQSMLPTATIVVAESERESYAREVDADKLVTHGGVEAGVSGLPKVYNWMQDNFDEEILVEIDDDLQKVMVWSGEGSRKIWVKLINPEDILQVIENGVQLAIDLDVTTFCWAKSQNAAFLKPDHRPYTPTGLVANAFGVRGAARHRPYDPDMIGRTSLDWTLRTLLADRAVLMNKRVFFDCGKIFGGSGGNSGIVTEEKYRLATERLKERWGRHIRFGANTEVASKNKKRGADGKVISSNQGDRQAMVIVSRHNKAAAR